MFTIPQPSSITFGSGLHLREGLYTLLEGAQRKINITAFSFTIPKSNENCPLIHLLSIMKKKIREGVQINIILNRKFPSAMQYAQSIATHKLLKLMGCNVLFFPAHTVLHSKLIIVDDSSFFCGSANLSNSSLVNAVEFGIFCADTALCQGPINFFDNVWLIAKGINIE